MFFSGPEDFLRLAQGMRPFHYLISTYKRTTSVFSGDPLLVISVLVAAGADINALDAFGRTPLRLALELDFGFRKDSIVAELLTYGAKVPAGVQVSAEASKLALKGIAARTKATDAMSWLKSNRKDLAKKFKARCSSRVCDTWAESAFFTEIAICTSQVKGKECPHRAVRVIRSMLGSTSLTGARAPVTGCPCLWPLAHRMFSRRKKARSRISPMREARGGAR